MRHPLRFPLVALLLAIPAAAHALPLPASAAPADPALGTRATDVVVVPRATGTRGTTRFDPARSCAAAGVTQLLRAHAGRGTLLPLPSPHTADIGDLAVIEDDGTFFYTHNSGNPKVDLQAVSRAFYRSHGDDYDALAVFLPSGMSDWLGSPTSFAAAYPIKNQVTGLNLPIMDESAGMGSAGRLELLMSMNGLDRYLDDPNAVITALGLDLTGEQTIGHEFQHRWGAYVLVESLGVARTDLLGRDDQHWSFFLDSDASVLDGCDWVAAGPDSFWIDEVQDRYGRLDQYLMGVRKPEEVGPVLLVTEPTNLEPPGNWVASSIPTVGVGADATPRWVGIDDIIAANGPRIPAAPDTVPTFHVAFVLATPRDTPPSAGDLARLDSLRADFVPWIETATDGRARVDTRLAPTPPRLVVVHTPLRDTEDTTTPRPVGAQVLLRGGNLAATLDPAGVQVRWRAAVDPVFDEIPMTPAGADSFSAVIPAVSGDVEYAIVAATTPPIATATLPEDADSVFHYHAGPDRIPPTIVHVPVMDQVAWHLPQPLLARVTDDEAVDSVWVEYTLDGGALQSQRANAVGVDSFGVTLGASLARGGRIAYRFEARDDAAAPNFAVSSTTFDTLVVGDEMAEDFENGAPFVHDSSIYSYRDAWHPELDPLDPTRGVGMHAGADDGGPYAPHLDSSLYTPYLYAIPPGATLQFDHRYQLENADTQYGYDGAMLECSVAGGPWQELTPAGGYPFALASKVSTVPAETPIWSGDSQGWRTESVDLAPLGTGPAIVRWRMVTDDFIGRDGWRVDHVRIQWPSGLAAVPLETDPRARRLWPNPARRTVAMSAPDAPAGDGAWELYDIGGRRVATLWRGRFVAGASLHAEIPPGMAPGLYFARLRIGTRVVADQRVALLR